MARGVPFSFSHSSVWNRNDAVLSRTRSFRLETGLAEWTHDWQRKASSAAQNQRARLRMQPSHARAVFAPTTCATLLTSDIVSRPVDPGRSECVPESNAEHCWAFGWLFKRTEFRNGRMDGMCESQRQKVAL